MPRYSRIVILNIPHHVTQRGNYRQNVFESDPDYEKYSLWFNEYVAKYKLEVLAYCLMYNHIHFIAILSKEATLAKLFYTLYMRYTQYVNKKLKVTGHLWQGRFFSCVLDEEHLYRATRYVETNPVRAKIVKKRGYLDGQELGCMREKERGVQLSLVPHLSGCLQRNGKIILVRQMKICVKK